MSRHTAVARFTGTFCWFCKSHIEVGSRMARYGVSWVHADCLWPEHAESQLP